jgi:hypothetical protein
MATLAFKKYCDGDTVFRHGDVMLKKTANRLLKRRTSKRLLLHKGSSNEHVVEGKVYLREDSGRRFLGVVGPSTVKHVGGSAGHKDINLDPKDLMGLELEVDSVVEYDHFLEESRAVID